MPEKESKNADSGFSLQDYELEKALLAGDHADLLEQYLGEAEYDELRKLTRDAQVSSVRGGPRVYILPGIMGSKLGKRGLIFDDVLWFDPAEIAFGKLEKLALKVKPSVYEPVGVILFAYLKLKLRLIIKGYDASFYPFDWRQDIKGVGQKLAETLKNENRRDINLVVHSMGGLVARAAAAHLGPDSTIKRMPASIKRRSRGCALKETNLLMSHPWKGMEPFLWHLPSCRESRHTTSRKATAACPITGRWLRPSPISSKKRTPANCRTNGVRRDAAPFRCCAMPIWIRLNFSMAGAAGSCGQAKSAGCWRKSPLRAGVSPLNPCGRQGRRRMPPVEDSPTNSPTW
ncbi:MAG: hypothetical protein P8X90_27870 [Desulfobacterales bacterium]